MNKWTMFYPDEFKLQDVPDYAAFVYLIQFPETGCYYIGVKQVYKGLKNIRDLNDKTTQSNWIVYTGSSKVVNEDINSGLKYKKQILWCFNTVQEAVLMESALICCLGTDRNCLNQAIMVKTKIKKDFGEQRETLQRLLGDLL